MVIDSSAIIAILMREIEVEKFAQILSEENSLHISVAALLEIFIVLKNKRKQPDENIQSTINNFLNLYGIQTVPVTYEQITLAQSAFGKYGKGQGHPAQLNFGDCFAYALAKEMNLPLLFKGDDFKQTDIQSVCA